MKRFEAESTDRDERLGEAIEAYLALAESGSPPDPDAFASGYPDLGNDLREALAGLALVQGLVGVSADGSSRLEAGRRVAGYRIVRELGRGGMGVVYEAVHVDLDRPVALKVLAAHAAPDPSSRRRFLNEAKTAAALHHTHIVPVFDVGQVGGLCYYAMQRIEGCGLDRVLKTLRRGRSTAAGSGTGTSHRKAASDPAAVDTATWLSKGHAPLPAADDECPPFDPPRGSAYFRWVAQAGRQAAEALAHAHRRGVVHRDVKPSNLLLDARGTVWVADFGLARRLTDPDPALSQTDSRPGTPRYMSPEQFAAGPIDGRTDVYSLGATLYELLTLRTPFDGKTVAELGRQIGEREPTSPRKLDARIPRDLETIVLKAMAKRPVDRYASAADLADDLGRFLGHEPVKARRISLAGRLWRFARRHPTVSIVTTAATVAILATAAIAYVRVRHERDRLALAQAETQEALRAARAAHLGTQAAMRELQLNQASLLRTMPVPNRRGRGLARLTEAAVGASPTLRSKLRDEALEFLVLRDVEAGPALTVDRTWGVALGSDGNRMGVLSADGMEFSLWDVARRERLAVHALATGPHDSVPESPGPRLANFPPAFSTGIAAAGSLMAVLWPNGLGIRLFDTVGGAHLGDLETPSHQILSVLATPDGRRLVTVDCDPATGLEGGTRAHLWDPDRMTQPLATLLEARRGGPGRPPVGPPVVALDPEGKTIAVARRGEREIALWSADEGRAADEPIEAPMGVTALALGPEGMLAAGVGGTIRLWAVEARGGAPSPLSSLTRNSGEVRALRFGRGREALLAVVGQDAGVELWDPAANSLVATLPTPDRVQDLTFSPGPKARLWAVAGGQAASWAVVEPTARVRFSGDETAPLNLAFGPDGGLAMTFWGEPGFQLRLWHPEVCPARSPALDGTSRIAVAFDDRGRLAVLDAGRLAWLSPPEREPTGHIDLPGPKGRGFGGRGAWPLRAVARSADGRTLALGRGSDILLWRADDPGRVTKVESPPHSAPARSWWRDLALSPTGDRLYLLGFDRQVLAWSLDPEGTRALDWSDLPDDVEALALSPDGRTLALGRRSGEVALVATAAGQVTRRLPGDEAEPVTALDFAPAGDQLAVGTRPGAIRLWSWRGEHPAPLVRLPGLPGGVVALAYDPRGRRLAASDDKAIHVWDLDRVRLLLGPLGLAW